MLKLLLLILGLAGGAGGAVSWLLSEPGTPEQGPPAGRLGDLKQRVHIALEEGKKAGAETENRLRQQLDAYRGHPRTSQSTVDALTDSAQRGVW